MIDDEDNDDDDDDDDDGEESSGGGGGSGGGGKSRTDPLGADPKEAKTQEDLSRATPPRTIGPGSPLEINPPSPSTDNIHPRITFNSLELKPSKKMEAAGMAKKTAAKKDDIMDGIPDVDELAKRFAALKR